MNRKTTIGLVLALAIVLAALWWAQSPADKTENAMIDAGPKALIEPPLGDLAGFEVKVGDEPALVFEKANDRWRMKAPVEWPGDSSTVDADANRIKDLKYVQAYAKNDPDRPTDQMTSLAAPRRIVKLMDKEGRSCVVKVGARQALSTKTYVQREGDEAICLVEADLNSEMRRGLSDYRGKRVAEFDQANAVKIEVTGERRYTLVKGAGGWMVDSPVKGRADASKVSSLLRSLSSLTAKKFVDDAPASFRPFGLEPPKLTVVVTTEKKIEKPKATTEPASAPAEPEYETQTQTVSVALGGAAADDVFAKLGDESKRTVFQVAESAVDQVAPPLGDLRDKKVAAMEPRRVQRVVLAAEGDEVELTKAGARWQIAAGTGLGQGAAAEYAAVDELLSAIKNLTATGFEETELPTQGFDKPRAEIELTLEGQLEPTRLTVGGLTASKTGVYIRNNTEGFVAVVGAADADRLVAKPLSFLSRELLRFPSARASRIRFVKQGSEASEVAREDGVWAFKAPIEGPAETTAVNNILSDLSNLRGRRVVGRAAEAAAFGLDHPAVRAVVTVDAPPRPKPASQPASSQADGPTPPSSGETATKPAVEGAAEPTGRAGAEDAAKPVGTPEAEAKPTNQLAEAAPSSQPAEAAPSSQPVEKQAEPEPPPEPPTIHAILVGRHGDTVCAMVEGGSTICEVDAKVLEDLEAELLDTKVTTFDPTNAVRVSFEGATGFAFEKAGVDWTLVGEPSFQTKAAAVTQLLDALRDLKAGRYVRYKEAVLSEFGLDAPAVTLRVESQAGDALELRISAAGPQDGGRYAFVSTMPGRVFVVKAEDVAKFTKQVQDFHQGA